MSSTKERIRGTVFVSAKRDTYINKMNNMDVEFFIPKGTMMFHEASPNQTKYLENDEICVYLPSFGVCYGYIHDWEDIKTVSDRD